MQQKLESEELVRRAIAGDQDSLSALAELARPRVCAYVRRVVLHDESAQDITQEAMVAMLASRNQLRDPLSFWAWLFTIVNNKIRLFYRRAELHPKPFADREHPLDPVAPEPDPAERLERAELVELTQGAFAELDVRHRMVLAMRFYEDLSHEAIGGILGCSESSARVAFFRAKRALLRRLRKRGIGGVTLGMALAAFGEATRPATAGAIKISAVALREGSRHLLQTGVSGAGALLIMLLFLPWAHEAPANRSPAPAAILAVHFSEQSESAYCDTQYARTLSKGAYERWYVFPEGSGGPFLSRVQLWDPFMTHKICWWLQNDTGNYHVEPGHKITLSNARLYGNEVRTLPTDPEDLFQFIGEVQDRRISGLTTTQPSHGAERDPRTGFLRSKIDYRFPELGPFQTTYEYTDLPSSLFATPSGMKIVDERDAMHFRGWNYFRVTGQLGGHRVTGTGQIPFLSSLYKTHPPWLHLEIEGQARIGDIDAGAWIAAPGDGAAALSVFRAETFFCGLPRPWSGFHTVDVIRRDAAARRIWFDTHAAEGDEQYVIVRLTDRRFNPPVIAVYRIDVQRDVLDQVTFSLEGADGLSKDVLEFQYVQSLELLEHEFVAPAQPPHASADSKMPDQGPMWPYLLATENASR